MMKFSIYYDFSYLFLLKKAANIRASEELMMEKELPLQYYSAYSIVIFLSL